MPELGQLAAVVLELPIVLTVSWYVSAFSTRRAGIPGNLFLQRIIMGVLSFVLLMNMELVVSVVVFKQPAAAFVSSLSTPHGLLGLAGQAMFGTFPYLQHSAAEKKSE